jgi:hypothetical protein
MYHLDNTNLSTADYFDRSVGHEGAEVGKLEPKYRAKWTFKHMSGICRTPFINQREEEMMAMHSPESDLGKYIQMDTKPAPIPQYWHWSVFKIQTDLSAELFRDQLFQYYKTLGLQIRPLHSGWKYLYTKDGLEIECYFFSDGPTTIVDINLISGDRWAWRTISMRMREFKPMKARM